MAPNTRLKAAIAEEHPEWVVPRDCQQQATRQGMLIAVVAGIITLPVARKAGLDRNKALITALGISSIAGYVTSKVVYEQCRFVT